MPNKKAWFLRLFRLVWVTRHSCPGDHAAKAKVSSLDAFAFNKVAWFTVIAYCVASFAISPCRNWFIPIKKTFNNPEQIVYKTSYAPQVNPMPIIKHKNPFGGDAGLCPQVHNAFATKELQQYRYYTTHLFMCQPWPVLPPRFENVETIKSIRTQWLLRLHQWQNCNLDSFVVPPRFQLDHGIQQQGHCNYGKHDQHDQLYPFTALPSIRGLPFAWASIILLRSRSGGSGPQPNLAHSSSE